MIITSLVNILVDRLCKYNNSVIELPLCAHSKIKHVLSSCFYLEILSL